MMTPRLPILTDFTGHLATLAGTLQIPSSEQRAQTIRRAEKSLVALESFFTHQLGNKVKRWREANLAVGVLRGKLTEFEDRERELRACQEELDSRADFMKLWARLVPLEREAINEILQKAHDFQDRRLDRSEAHILHRYRRFTALRALLSYAENAEHLCEAIFHFENAKKYEENLDVLEIRLVRARERLASVRRGLLLAVLCCVFLFTLPLCLPFAFSLWSRRREIETQISNLEDGLRRERRRIELAAEGSVASQTIREILGDISLEQIRRTLTEVYELRTEFVRPDRTRNTVASFMAAVECQQSLLESLFGALPEDPVEIAQWLVEHVGQAQRIELDVRYWRDQIEELTERQRCVLKGYSREILLHSLTSLEEERSRNEVLPVAGDVQDTFVEVCMAMPDLLVSVRKALWHITHAHSVIELHWRLLQNQVLTQANFLGLVVVALLALESEGVCFDDSEDDGGSHPMAAGELG